MTEKESKRIARMMENGIPYESVIEELAKATGDEKFIETINFYLAINHNKDEKKDLTQKLNTLGDKIDNIGTHMDSSNKDDLMKVAETYYNTLLRIQKKITDL